MNKTFIKIGAIVGSVVALMGLLMLCGAFMPTFSTASTSYLYDSGYASFGGDFYTYVNNNAHEAAAAAMSANQNIKTLAKFESRFFGLALMSFGLLGISYFLNEGVKADAKTETAEKQMLALKAVKDAVVEKEIFQTVQSPAFDLEPASDPSAQEEPLS